MTYAFLADLVLIVHCAFVLLVVVTVPLILFGAWRGWSWVHIPWLRFLHLGGIFTVVAQAWVGIICPLTNLEMWLRRQAGLATYTESFVAHWLHKFLYWDLPPWAFVVAYTLFAVLALGAWWLVPRRGAGVNHKPGS